MKAVILAGGFGTRLSEETATKTKPIFEVGWKHLIWHILKTYYYYGINDFIICCGYKGYMIKDFCKLFPSHIRYRGKFHRQQREFLMSGQSLT